PRGRRADGARGDGQQGQRGPVVLPDEPWPVRGRGDGDDRAWVRRADRARAADGVRAGAQPVDRAADGRCCRLIRLNMDTFPVPTGREEAWRFTPTRRLRGLLEPLPDGGDGKVVVDVDAPGGVTVDRIEPRQDARVGKVFRATERISALAFEGV